MNIRRSLPKDLAIIDRFLKVTKVDRQQAVKTCFVGHQARLLAMASVLSAMISALRLRNAVRSKAGDERHTPSVALTNVFAV